METEINENSKNSKLQEPQWVESPLPGYEDMAVQTVEVDLDEPSLKIAAKYPLAGSGFVPLSIMKIEAYCEEAGRRGEPCPTLRNLADHFSSCFMPRSGKKVTETKMWYFCKEFDFDRKAAWKKGHDEKNGSDALPMRDFVIQQIESEGMSGNRKPTVGSLLNALLAHGYLFSDGSIIRWPLLAAWIQAEAIDIDTIWEKAYEEGKNNPVINKVAMVESFIFKAGMNGEIMPTLDKIGEQLRNHGIKGRWHAPTVQYFLKENALDRETIWQKGREMGQDAGLKMPSVEDVIRQMMKERANKNQPVPTYHELAERCNEKRLKTAYDKAWTPSGIYNYIKRNSIVLQKIWDEAYGVKPYDPLMKYAADDQTPDAFNIAPRPIES